MRILILGAGGIGGYFGARLIEAGADITFLVREQRRQRLAKDGLRIESPHGNLTLQVKTVTADTVTPDFDLVILAPKAYDLDSALASLTGAVSDNTVLLPFLNGLAHMQILDRRFGVDRVMGGVAQIAAQLTEAGLIRQLTPLHSLTVGHRSPAHKELAGAFFALCHSAGFDSVYAENIEQALWQKWTFLATLAGSTTLFRGSVGKIVASATGDAAVRAMYAESLRVAFEYGFPIAGGAQQNSLAMLTQAGSTVTASMLRDLLSGNRTEHEHILGELVRMGQSKGVDTPLLGIAYSHLQVESSR